MPIDQYTVLVFPLETLHPGKTGVVDRPIHFLEVTSPWTPEKGGWVNSGGWSPGTRPM